MYSVVPVPVVRVARDVDDVFYRSASIKNLLPEVHDDELHPTHPECQEGNNCQKKAITAKKEEGNNCQTARAMTAKERRMRIMMTYGTSYEDHDDIWNVV